MKTEYESTEQLELKPPPQKVITRYDETREQFIKYHRKHPEVYRLFIKFTFELINRGYKNGSVAMIIERIRWETMVNPVDPKKEFKIGNNHKPFYARLFMYNHKEHDGFFRTRYMFSKEHAATGHEFTPQNIMEA